MRKAQQSLASYKRKLAIFNRHSSKESQPLSQAISFASVGLLAASLLTTGCTTIPKDFSKKQQGTFSAKVLIRDLKKSKSYVVNAKVQAQKPKNLRLDITSPLAGHLFSLTVKGENVEYLVVKQKKHIVTKANAGALREVIPVSINPTRLLNIFFGNPIEDKNWSCTKKDGKLHTCSEQATKTEITWEPVTNDQRRIKIDQPGRAKLQISISDFKDELDLSKKPFDLTVPKSFRTIQR